MLLESAISGFLVSLRAKGRAPSTIVWYDEQFAVFRGWRAGSRDDLPDADEIDAFLAAQHERSSPNTVHARYRALRALLKWCEKRRKISHDQNPIYLVDAPHVPSVRQRHVTKDDLDLLLRSIGGVTWLDQRDKLIVMLLFYCGLRRGELVALRVADIDTGRLELTVRKGKGGKARIVPFFDQVRTALVAYLFCRPNHCDMLLVKSDGYGQSNGPLRGEGVRQMLLRRFKALGVKAFSPHAFRHGYAMWLLNNGVRMESVSDLMGHSDMAVTSKVYAFTLASTTRKEYDDAVRRMNV